MLAVMLLLTACSSSNENNDNEVIEKNAASATVQGNQTDSEPENDDKTFLPQSTDNQEDEADNDGTNMTGDSSATSVSGSAANADTSTGTARPSETQSSGSSTTATAKVNATSKTTATSIAAKPISTSSVTTSTKKTAVTAINAATSTKNPTTTAKPASTSDAATSTKKPTATAKPTVTTAKPTATTHASTYYWSDEVTEYLTGDPSRFGYIRSGLTSVERYKPNLDGTIFGKCAVGVNAGVWCVDGYEMFVESVNKNGVISQAYRNRWYDAFVYEWVEEKRVTGVYLDINYEKPGVEPDTEIDLLLTQYQELVEYNVFGVNVVVEQNKTNDMAVNFYPLDTGDFVLDIGGVPIILNGIPKTVLVRGGPSVNGLHDLQVSVNGHVVYEADWLGNKCDF